MQTHSLDIDARRAIDLNEWSRKHSSASPPSFAAPQSAHMGFGSPLAFFPRGPYVSLLGPSASTSPRRRHSHSAQSRSHPSRGRRAIFFSAHLFVAHRHRGCLFTACEPPLMKLPATPTTAMFGRKRRYIRPFFVAIDHLASAPNYSERASNVVGCALTRALVEARTYIRRAHSLTLTARARIIEARTYIRRDHSLTLTARARITIFPDTDIDNPYF